MKIDSKLNLVIPIERETGTVYVHSTPLSSDVFDRYFLLIGKTFAAIYTEGLALAAGPRVAAKLLKVVAGNMGISADEVETGILAEIRRLTNVLILENGKWEQVMFDDARLSSVFDEDEIGEIEGAIVFFILASAMHLKAEKTVVLNQFARLYRALVTSFSLTEYRNSLPISKPEDATEKKAELSSIPS